MRSISNNRVILLQIWTEVQRKLMQNFGMPTVFRRFKALSEERESIEDESCSRGPSFSRTDENIDKIRDCVFRSSINSQNDRGTVEFQSHHFDQ